MVNGACSGGQQVKFPLYLQDSAPTPTIVPRMSNGAELTFILPIVNAPFRIYYAYNPLRLYQGPAAAAHDRSRHASRTSFRSLPIRRRHSTPTSRRCSIYGANYKLREPRKTFRFTVARPSRSYKAVISTEGFAA